MRPKRKTHAERVQEREDAVLKQEFMLSGGQKGSSKTANDLPNEIERPRPSKTFKVVGIAILIFLVGAFIYSVRSQHRLLVRENPPAVEQGE